MTKVSQNNKRLIKDFYDKEAKIYDKTREWYEKGRFGKRERKIYLEFIRKRSLILVLASGTGRHFNFLANNLKCEIVGIDISLEMTRLSKEKHKDIYHQVHLIVGDVKYLPFREKSFDVVLCSRALYLFLNKMRVLKETYRVLKEGGKVAMSSVFKDLLLTRLGIKLGVFEDDPKYFPYTSEDLVEMFRKASFKNIRRKCIVIFTGEPYYIPQFIYKLLNKLEDKLQGGRWTIIIGER